MVAHADEAFAKDPQPTILCTVGELRIAEGLGSREPAFAGPENFSSGLKLRGPNADEGLKVRASRAYLAGFGTSGSLLAGAALMFLLASAIVGFHGWPQVGGQSPIANVAFPRVTLSPSSRTQRILAAVPTRTLVAGLDSAASAARPVAGRAAGSAGARAPGWRDRRLPAAASPAASPV